VKWLAVGLLFVLFLLACGEPVEAPDAEAEFARGGKGGKAALTLDSTRIAPDSVGVDPLGEIHFVVTFFVRGNEYLLRQADGLLYRKGDGCLRRKPQPISVPDANTARLIASNAVTGEVTSSALYMGVTMNLCPK